MLTKKDGVITVTKGTDDVRLVDALVVYGGGGYDGCVVQYNAAYFDHLGKFYSVFHSGVRGCDTVEKLEAKLLNYAEDSEDTICPTSIVSLSEEKSADFKKWASTQSVELLLKIGTFLHEEFCIDLIAHCDKCKGEFNLYEMRGDNERDVNGTPIKYRRNLKCESCYDEDNPVCSECGDDCNIHTKKCTNYDCTMCPDYQEETLSPPDEIAKSIDELYDIDKLSIAMQNAYDQLVKTDAFDFDNDAALQVEEIASGALGTYQAQHICELYDIHGWKDYMTIDDNTALSEEVWESVIDPFFNNVCKQLMAVVRLKTIGGYGYTMEAAHLEADCSFGLNIVVTKI
jgi:hypothetical protein